MVWRQGRSIAFPMLCASHVLSRWQLRLLCLDSRHSSADVLFSGNYVNFTPESGRSRGLRWTSAPDPKRLSGPMRWKLFLPMSMPIVVT